MTEQPPFIPRSRTNPVGQTKRIRRARKVTNARLRRVEKMIIREWERMPFTIQNGRMLTNQFYEYLIRIDELEALVRRIAEALDDIGQETLAEQVRQSYREGTAKAVENLARISDDYTRTVTDALRSRPVLRRASLAATRVFELMDGFGTDVSTDMSRILFQAIQDGVNPVIVARDIRKRFGIHRRRAERIARTEITTALRRGRFDEAADAQDKFGLEVRLIHYSALIPGRTRTTHAQRHGRLVTIQEQREWYAQDGNAINCFLPGTRVNGQFVAGSKAWYEGEAVRVVTTSGNHLSVTPNHPVMTQRGLVAATELSKGDYLIAHNVGVPDFAGISPLNSHLIYPAVEDVFGALMQLGHSFTSGVRTVDFHGDGKFIKKDVHIVVADGVLRTAHDTELFKLLFDLNFVKSDFSLCSLGTLGSHLLRIDLSPSGSMGSGSTGFSFFRPETRTFEDLCIAGASGPQTTVFEPSVDLNTTDTVFLTEGKDRRAVDVFNVKMTNVNAGIKSGVSGSGKSLSLEPIRNGALRDVTRISDALDSFTGLTSFDQVVNVEKFSFAGHVYDLQECSGLMLANNIIASNCLCTATEVTVDEDGQPITGGKLIDRLVEQREKFVNAGAGEGNLW